MQPGRTRGTKSAMKIDATAPNVESPSCLNNRDRCSALIEETSALNCSANSATTASAADWGSATTTSAGNAGGRACAHRPAEPARDTTVARGHHNQSGQHITDWSRSRHPSHARARHHPQQSLTAPD
ncbi:hypothetical protein I551_2042 [Mycobacterium ulcerans str. Harvey]|uniref:Uncharacterized protein n=1 Tax=Mycobacterium ulcerans str. Harvey TaxID=1299332 RepID=A0ABN0R2L8_MYCUL|nr:hypothetical protein I551_2042 [Mycobacterium ulcerans str. Harvey]